jgi:hypothetical protein
VTLVVGQPFYFAHAKALGKVITSRTDTNWDFLFRSVWATTLRVEWCRALLGYYKVRFPSGEDQHDLIAFVADASSDSKETPLARTCRYLERVTAVLDREDGDKVGAINRELLSIRTEQITRTLRAVAEESKVRLITLIDGLDENWDGSNTSAELLTGLLTQAAADYATIGATTYAFVRENMYRRVSAICPRWDRLEAYFRHITWSEEQVAELVLRRIRSHSGGGSLDWDDLFEAEVHGMGSCTYILRRTQFKPREVILFCRYALDVARKHRAWRIRAQDILEAEQRYSDNRLKDLENEYQDGYPELDKVLNLFRGWPQVVSFDELLVQLREFVASGQLAAVAPRLSLSHPNAEALFDLLLSIGFLGVRTKQNGTFVFKYYGEEGNVFRSVSEIEEVSVHPAFQAALGLRHVVANLPTREAGDTDILTGGPSVSSRAAAPYEQETAIMGALRDAPVGVGGYGRYEEATRRGLAYAFQGYLDNPRVEERSWAGAAVRALVFENTGETPFFRSLRDEYGALVVPFECHNNSQLKASDFHEIEGRLRSGSGRCGFICYRGDRADPIREELKHLRNMYHRERERPVVVMLVSDVKMAQMVAKRMRGKLDQFLARWLRDYLGYLNA